jgi:hypothetical protein
MNESFKKINSTMAALIIAVTVVFLVVEALIWTGQVKVEALGNLGYGVDKLLENPAFVGLLTAAIVGAASGFMQNVFQKNDTFDLKKFAETFYYYEPLLILVAQFIPLKYGVVLLFVIDIFRRVLLKFAPDVS